MRLTIDFETRSALSIKNVGVWVYAEHAEPICLALQLGDRKPELWVAPRFRHLVGLPKIPASEVFACLQAADTVEAHNAEFERAIWKRIMVPRFGWPDIPDYKWRCSAAKAAAHALPRSLEGAGAAMRLTEQKDKAGHKLMLKMCRPRKARKGEDPYELHWYADATDFMALCRYCIQDVVTEHALSTALADLPPIELEVWRLDQRINERGILADVPSARRIVEMVRAHEKHLLAEVEEVSNYQLKSVKQVGAMAEFCGVENLRKDTVAAALETIEDPRARRLLEIRQSLGKASVSKYSAILNRASTDGRLRGTLLYHGATTGRWTGRGVQLQNLPRATMDPRFIDLAFDLLRAGDFEWIENLFGDPMDAAQQLIRSAFMAAPGHDLIAADYSAIEARVVMWLADDNTGLDIFLRGLDPYCEMASAIYEYPVAKSTHPRERQVGKTAILGLGYGMGAPKFRATVLSQTGLEIEKKFSRKVVKAYRTKFGQVPQYWYATERAAIEALQTGQEIECGRASWFTRGSFLHCRLPSGRLLSYPYPAIKLEPAFIYPCVDEDGKEMTIMIVSWENRDARAKKRANDEDLKIVGDPIEREKAVLSHMATSAKGDWFREATYGGKLVENIDQATARDIMAAAMLRLEAAGYPIVLSVHDEVVAEVLEDFGSVEEFISIMADSPSWAAGLPVAAEGWRGRRYRK